jgi:hypothetical protein
MCEIKAVISVSDEHATVRLHVPFLIAAARVSSDQFYCYTNFSVTITTCTVYNLRRATDLGPVSITHHDTIVRISDNRWR